MANGLEYKVELCVVVTQLPLQLVQLAGEVFVRRQDFTQPDERPHDGDVDLDGPVTVKDAGQHRNALFGEGVGQVLSVLPTL